MITLEKWLREGIDSNRVVHAARVSMTPDGDVQLHLRAFEQPEHDLVVLVHANTVDVIEQGKP